MGFCGSRDRAARPKTTTRYAKPALASGIEHLAAKVTDLDVALTGGHGLPILGSMVEPSPAEPVQRSIDPATGQLVTEVPLHDAAEVGNRLERSRSSFAHWRRYSLHERAARLERLAELFAEQREGLAELITREMGKPLREALAEIDKAQHLCSWLCSSGVEWLASQRLTHGPGVSPALLERIPAGGVLAVMPWNYPVWQPLRCAAPALLAGDTVLLKHAPNVPGIAQRLETLFYEAGFPEGVFLHLRVQECTVTHLIADPAIARVSLTGGYEAGRAVGAAAGAALKRCVLELGGSDPLLVLEDADLELVARAAVAARLRNAGQSCTAPKRVIAVASVAAALRDALAEELVRYVPANPRLSSTRLGPLARESVRQRLQLQLEQSQARGARVMLGGRCNPGPGYFYPATLVEGVGPGMPIFDEEVFGPLVALTIASDEARAVELANHSRYHLGASVWSADRTRALRVASLLAAGTVAINESVGSHPSRPFGGWGDSGCGRELGSDGLLELTEARVIVG
jgi:succinate-semialdehyde dehydrogenase/glutarate-semialdehyde dehydrogenase